MSLLLGLDAEKAFLFLIHKDYSNSLKLHNDTVFQPFKQTGPNSLLFFALNMEPLAGSIQQNFIWNPQPKIGLYVILSQTLLETSLPQVINHR